LSPEDVNVAEKKDKRESLSPSGEQIVKHGFSLCKQKFFDLPNMVGDSCFHRRRNANGLMNTDEVIPRRENRNSGFQMREFFTEPVRQASEAPKLHSYGEICALDVARANVFKVRFAADWGWDRCDNLGRPVPVRPRVVGRAVDLHELSKVHVGAEVFFHCSDVGLEAIRSDLQPSPHSAAEVSDKLQGAKPVSLTDAVRDYQLALGVQGEPRVGVSPFSGITFGQVFFLSVDETPCLVELNVAGSYVLDAGIENAAEFFRQP